MAAALGDEDYMSAAGEERDSDARRRDRVSNNNLQRDMTEVEPVSSMDVYEEAHRVYCEPCAFLVACRVVSCRKRWYAEMGAFQSSKTQSDNQPVRSCDGHAFPCRLGALHCSWCNRIASYTTKYDDLRLEMPCTTLGLFTMHTFNKCR